MSLTPEQLSPELVLVSPDLAEAARAALPDRPWEIHRDTPPARSVARSELSRLHRAGSAGGIALLVAGVAAFVGLLVAGSILPTRDAPSLAAVRPSPAADPLRQARATNVVGISSALRFEVDPRRHVISRLEGVFACAGRLTLENIGLRYDGTFTITRRFGGRDLVTIWVSGSVDAGDNVRGTLRALHSSCDTGPVAFEAHATRVDAPAVTSPLSARVREAVIR